MNRIGELCAAIKRLPTQRQFAAQARLLEQFAAKLTGAAQASKYVDDRLCHVKAVFAGSQFESVENQRTKVRISASKMRPVFEDQSISLNDSKFQADLTQISTLADGMKKKLIESWTKCIDDEYAKWRPVAALATELQGSQSILSALNVLQQHRSDPPANSGAAIKITSQINTVQTSLARLQLTGKVKQFVELALQGVAPGKDLLDVDVQEFINKAQLWSALIVKLGR